VRVLIVGSGGREHALAWKLSQSSLLEELHAAPGNPGIAALGQCHPVRSDDGEGLLGLAHALEIDLAVIGPEAPLVAGVADELRHAGIATFGPTAAAARIEGSKSFAKDVLSAAGVLAAAALDEPRAPCVVKADGLAAGKGVFVCRDQNELDAGLAAAAALGGQVVVEELLEGPELSVFALCDGRRALPIAAARDYKRLGDNDTGPNTGGMGGFSPVPPFAGPELESLVEQIHQPVLDELSARGAPFTGLLYAGLMLTGDGPRVLEFNCRFGDPETQAVLPCLDGDLLAALVAAAGGDLSGASVEHGDRAAVTVALTAGSYPEGRDVGSPISGIADAEALGALVFHAGTARRGGELLTNGGRILNVTGVGDDLDQARELAYEAAGAISFRGLRYRGDIGLAESHVSG
jgi:phosphoribosylamine--glycine ligase